MSEYINQSSCQRTKKAERSEKVQRWNDKNFGGEGSHVGPWEDWAKNCWNPTTPEPQQQHSQSRQSNIYPLRGYILKKFNKPKQPNNKPQQREFSGCHITFKLVVSLNFFFFFKHRAFVFQDRNLSIVWTSSTTTFFHLKKCLVWWNMQESEGKCI